MTRDVVPDDEMERTIECRRTDQRSDTSAGCGQTVERKSWASHSGREHGRRSPSSMVQSAGVVTTSEILDA